MLMPIPNPPLTPEDEDVIEQFRRHYAPPPRTAAQRAMMRNALAARLHRSWVPTWLSIAAATCAAGLALWLAMPDRSHSVPKPPAALSGDLLVAYALDGDTASEIDDLLPPDYTAIESALDL